MSCIFKLKVLIIVKPRSAIPKAMVVSVNASQTIQEEFYIVAFRKKMYDNLQEVHKDPDVWMAYYNQERPHSGRYCFGKTPMQTFIESLPLARQKPLNELSPSV
jgi:hypothetical protein